MSANLPDKKTFSISEAARFLGVSPETLRRWDRKGILKPYRTKGNQRRYSLANLEAFKVGEKAPGAPLSISQAAEYVGVHPETLRRWEKEGVIAPQRTNGNQRRYTRGELDQVKVTPEAPLPATQAKLAGVAGAVPPPSPPPPPEAIPAEPPLPPSLPPRIRVRTLEEYRPSPFARFYPLKRLAVITLALVVASFAWGVVPPLSKARIGRFFALSPLNPVVDVNDIFEYEIAEEQVFSLRAKFPLEVEQLVTDTLRVFKDGVFNTTQLLGTIFFGEGKRYFINRLGDATLRAATFFERVAIKTGITAGTALRISFEKATQTGNLTGVEVDFSKITDPPSTLTRYGVHVKDSPEPIATDYGVYVEGTNWDYGIYSEDDIYIDGTLEVNDDTTITGDILPGIDSTHDIGAVDREWANLYVDTLSAFGGTLSSLTVTGTSDLQGDVLDTTGNLTLNDSVDVSGDLTVSGGDIDGPLSSITMADGGWVGIGSAAERILFDGTGDDIEIMGANVGIGALDPYFTLDVVGDIRITSANKLFFGGTGAADNDVNLYRSAANTLKTDDLFIAAGVNPTLADTDSLGSTSAEWRNLYLGDAGKLYFGLNQDVALYRSASGVLRTSADFKQVADWPTQHTLYGYMSAAGDSPNTAWLRGKGTEASPASVGANDLLGQLYFAGYVAAGSGFSQAAAIKVFVDGTPGLGDMPGRIEFLTTPDGSGTPAERLRIDNAGKVWFDPSAALDTNLYRSAANTLKTDDGLIAASLTVSQDGDVVPATTTGTSDLGSSGTRWDNVFAVAGNFSGTVTGGDFSCTNCLDFAEFEDILDLDAALTLNQGTNTWIQNFTDTATTGFTYNANSLTSGKALNISSSATAFTGNLIDVTLSGSNAANTGSLLSLTNSGTSNTNTAFYIKHYATGTNNLAMRVDDVSGDTTPFVIDGSGNVGIGTTGPDNKLTVIGNIQVGEGGSDKSIYWNSDGTYGRITRDNSSGNLEIQTQTFAGPKYLVLNPEGGNVGIGTTGPSYPLDIYGTNGVLRVSDNTAMAAGVGGKIYFGARYQTGNENLYAIAHIEAGKSNADTGDASGYLAFKTHLSGTGTQEHMRIDKNGNVGIGTTVPGAKLDVNGNIAAGGYVDITGFTEKRVEVIGGDAHIWDDSSLGSEFLGNEGFETAGAGGADIWAIWTETAADGALNDEGTLVHSGSHAAKVTAGAAGTTRAQQAFAVTAGQLYKITLWTRGDGTNTGRWALYDNTNTVTIVDFVSTGVSGTTYTQVSFYFTAPAGCSLITFYIKCPAADGGIAYFDDVSIKEVTGGDLIARGILTGGGTSGIKIDSSGNVGIGTTSPSELLHLSKSGLAELIIEDTSGDSDARVHYISGTTDWYTYVDADQGDEFRIQNEGTVHMVVETGGNVGIGTTGPDGPLHVHRASAGAVAPDASGDELVVESDSNTGISVLSPDNLAANLYFGFPSDPGSMAIMTYGPTHASRANEMWFRVASNNRMIIDSSGNVGINDTTPSQKLDVGGNVRADDFIEYTEDFTGDAIAILQDVKVRGGEGEWEPVDHSSWPSEVIIENIEEGTCAEQDLPDHAECIDLGDNQCKVFTRSLSGVSSINTRAIQQLIAKTDQMEVGGDGEITILGNVGIGTTSPAGYRLKVAGTVRASGGFSTGDEIFIGNLDETTDYIQGTINLDILGTGEHDLTIRDWKAVRIESPLLIGGQSLEEYLKTLMNAEEEILVDVEGDLAQETSDGTMEKIIAQEIEAETGIFQRLAAKIGEFVSLIVDSIKAKTAEIAEAVIQTLRVEKLSADSAEVKEFSVTETSGRAVVAAGESNKFVENTYVKEQSKVFVTFKDPYRPATQYWVSELKEGEGFTVSLDQAVEAEASFDYWVVN